MKQNQIDTLLCIACIVAFIAIKEFVGAVIFLIALLIIVFGRKK